MFKKIISAVIALSIAASFAIAPVNAAEEITWVEPTPLATISNPDCYDASTNTDVTSTAPLKGYGLTTPSIWTVIYPPTRLSEASSDWSKYNAFGYDIANADKKNTAPAVRFSLRSGVSNETLLGNFSFADNTAHDLGAKTPLNKPAYMVEMDFSTSLRKGSFRYDFVGDTGTIASMNIKYDSATKGNISFNSLSKTMEIPLDGSSLNEIDYLKLYIDIEKQTVTAWAKTRGSNKSYATNISVNPSNLLAEDVPFLSKDVTSFTNLKIYATGTNSDRTDISILKISELSDNNIVADAQTYLTVPAFTESDLTLPTVLHGANVEWTSLTPNIITNDGKITQTNEDQDAVLTAKISRNGVETEKTFNIKVKRLIPVPEDGVWASEEINYTSASDMFKVASETDFSYSDQTWEPKSSTPAADSKDAVDTSNSGYSYLENGKYVVLRGSVSDSAEARYRFIGTKQLTSGTKVVEWKFTPINNPADIQFNIASNDSYTGVDTIYWRKGVVTTNKSKINKNTTGDVTLTAVININNKTYDLYINGELAQADIAWRGPGQTHIARLGITVASSSAKDSGLAIDYVRCMDTVDAYAAFCAKHESPVIDTEITSDEASIALPTSGEYSTISWASDNETIIATDGTVKHGAEDVVVNLTPTYTNKVVGSSAQGAPIAVTVKARAAQTTYGETEVINPDDDLITDGQYAVGFLGTFESKNTGLAPTFGFKLTYTGKSDMDVKIDANLETSIKAGIILTYTEEDGFDINNLNVQSYVTE